MIKTHDLIRSRVPWSYSHCSTRTGIEFLTGLYASLVLFMAKDQYFQLSHFLNWFLLIHNRFAASRNRATRRRQNFTLCAVSGFAHFSQSFSCRKRCTFLFQRSQLWHNLQSIYKILIRNAILLKALISYTRALLSKIRSDICFQNPQYTLNQSKDVLK